MGCQNYDNIYEQNKMMIILKNLIKCESAIVNKILQGMNVEYLGIKITIATI